jgi:hypothetical protein
MAERTPDLVVVLKFPAAHLGGGHCQIHPQRVKTAPSLGCVIGCRGGALVAVGLMRPRGVLVMLEEPMDRRWLPIRRPTFHGVVNRTFALREPDWGQLGHIDRCSPSGGVR